MLALNAALYFLLDVTASFNPNAPALLVGLSVENYEHFSNLNHIITVAGGLISASLRTEPSLHGDVPDVLTFMYDLFLKNDDEFEYIGQHSY